MPVKYAADAINTTRTYYVPVGTEGNPHQATREWVREVLAERPGTITSMTLDRGMDVMCVNVHGSVVTHNVLALYFGHNDEQS